MINYMLFKSLIIIYILLKFIKYYNNYLDLNKTYIKYQRELNLTFHNKIQKKIRIGIYTFCMKNGGRARITSILINLLYKIKIFNIYLFTFKDKEDNEYNYPKDIKRLIIKNNNIIKIFKNEIDILIMQINNYKKMKFLNNNKKIKIIYYLHNSIFQIIYLNYTYMNIYKEYIKFKYIISLIPFERDYLFKKWGINSFLFNNFITYNYNITFPSILSSKIILMIGRGNDKKKRFEKGIRSMEYIIQHIEGCELKIISKLYGINNLINLINNLNLGNKIKIERFKENIELFFKNASLHFFPTITESFGLILSETKIFGIPNILLGLDYVSIAQNGTIIIYDDTPESLAKEAIKILLNNTFRENLGKESRKNMFKYRNDLLILKWIKIIFYIFNDDHYYKEIQKKNIKMSEKYGLFILNKQIQLLKMRNNCFKNITINNFLNLNF